MTIRRNIHFKIFEYFDFVKKIEYFLPWSSFAGHHFSNSVTAFFVELIDLNWNLIGFIGFGMKWPFFGRNFRVSLICAPLHESLLAL